MKQLDADVCIVGAGISGMTAAYRIHQAHASAAVLEAGERLGGRMYTSRLTDGRSVFEIGAEWISDDSLQPSIRALMRDLEADLGKTYATVPQYIDGDTVFVDFDGTVKYYDAYPPDGSESLGLPPIPPRAKEELIEAFAALAYMSALVHPDARWAPETFDPTLSGGVESTVAADRTTLYAWIERNLKEPAAKALVSALFRATMGLEPEAIGMLHVLFFLQTFGCDPTSLIGAQAGQAQYLRMPGGVTEILDDIANLVGPERFVTGSPVRDIEQYADYVVVRSENATVTARRAILATSTAAVNLIRFHPPLPPDRAQLQQRMGLGSFWKVWLVYDSPFWRVPGYRGRPRGLNGALTSVRKSSYVATTLDSTLDPTGPGLFTCFIDGDKARAFAHLSYAERRQAVIGEMAHAFGPEFANLSTAVMYPAVPPQAPEPSAYFEWNWSLPEFIRGDYAGAPGPGVYTAEGFGPTIHTPYRLVHWAGGDSGQECYGSMDGAVWSGEQAAKEALAKEAVLQ